MVATAPPGPINNKTKNYSRTLFPATWAILTKGYAGMYNEISDWAQQTTTGMYADAVSDADCGGDPRMRGSNSWNNREKGVKRAWRSE